LELGEGGPAGMLGLETFRVLKGSGFRVEGCPRPWLCLAVRGGGPPVMAPVDWPMHVGLLEGGVVRLASGGGLSGRVLLRDPLTLGVVGEAVLSGGSGPARLVEGWRGTWLLVDAGECRGEVEGVLERVSRGAGLVYAVLAYSPRRPERLPRWPPLRAPEECPPPVEAPLGGDPLQG